MTVAKRRHSCHWIFYPESESLSIYEMFVASTMRGRGVGEKLLQEIERMAKTKGYSRVQLGARPLGNYPEAKLMEWYKKRGYEKPADHLANVMEKALK